MSFTNQNSYRMRGRFSGNNMRPTRPQTWHGNYHYDHASDLNHTSQSSQYSNYERFDVEYRYQEQRQGQRFNYERFDVEYRYQNQRQGQRFDDERLDVEYRYQNQRQGQRFDDERLDVDYRYQNQRQGQRFDDERFDVDYRYQNQRQGQRFNQPRNIGHRHPMSGHDRNPCNIPVPLMDIHLQHQPSVNLDFTQSYPVYTGNWQNQCEVDGIGDNSYRRQQQRNAQPKRKQQTNAQQMNMQQSKAQHAVAEQSNTQVKPQQLNTQARLQQMSAQQVSTQLNTQHISVQQRSKQQGTQKQNTLKMLCSDKTGTQDKDDKISEKEKNSSRSKGDGYTNSVVGNKCTSNEVTCSTDVSSPKKKEICKQKTMKSGVSGTQKHDDGKGTVKNKTNQRVLIISDMEGEGTLSKIGDEGTLSKIKGEGTLNKIKGEGTLIKMEGEEENLSKMEGGGTLSKMEGEGTLSKMEGGGTLSKMEGGGTLSKMEGEGTLSKMEGNMTVYDTGSNVTSCKIELCENIRGQESLKQGGGQVSSSNVSDHKNNSGCKDSMETTGTTSTSSYEMFGNKQIQELATGVQGQEPSSYEYLQGHMTLKSQSQDNSNDANGQKFSFSLQNKEILGQETSCNTREQKIKCDKQGQEIPSNIQGQETPCKIQGQEIKCNKQGQETSCNIQGQETPCNIQGQETSSNIQGQDTSCNIQGQETSCNIQGQEILCDMHGQETSCSIAQGQENLGYVKGQETLYSVQHQRHYHVEKTGEILSKEMPKCMQGEKVVSHTQSLDTSNIVQAQETLIEKEKSNIKGHTTKRIYGKKGNDKNYKKHETSDDEKYQGTSKNFEWQQKASKNKHQGILNEMLKNSAVIDKLDNRETGGEYKPIYRGGGLKVSNNSVKTKQRACRDEQNSSDSMRNRVVKQINRVSLGDGGISKGKNFNHGSGDRVSQQAETTGKIEPKQTPDKKQCHQAVVSAPNVSLSRSDCSDVMMDDNDSHSSRWLSARSTYDSLSVRPQPDLNCNQGSGVSSHRKQYQNKADNTEKNSKHSVSDSRGQNSHSSLSENRASDFKAKNSDYYRQTSHKNETRQDDYGEHRSTKRRGDTTESRWHKSLSLGYGSHDKHRHDDHTYHRSASEPAFQELRTPENARSYREYREAKERQERAKSDMSERRIADDSYSPKRKDSLAAYGKWEQRRSLFDSKISLHQISDNNVNRKSTTNTDNSSKKRHVSGEVIRPVAIKSTDLVTSERDSNILMSQCKSRVYKYSSYFGLDSKTESEEIAKQGHLGSAEPTISISSHLNTPSRSNRRLSSSNSRKVQNLVHVHCDVRRNSDSSPLQISKLTDINTIPDTSKSKCISNSDTGLGSELPSTQNRMDSNHSSFSSLHFDQMDDKNKCSGFSQNIQKKEMDVNDSNRVSSGSAIKKDISECNTSQILGKEGEETKATVTVDEVQTYHSTLPEQTFKVINPYVDATEHTYGSDNDIDLEDSDDELEAPSFLIDLENACNKPIPGTPPLSFYHSPTPGSPVPSRVTVEMHPPGDRASSFSLDMLVAERTEKSKEQKEIEEIHAELERELSLGGFIKDTLEKIEEPKQDELLPEHQVQLQQFEVLKSVLKETHPGEAIFQPTLHQRLFNSALPLQLCGFVPGASYIDRYLSTIEPRDYSNIFTSDVLVQCMENVSQPDPVLRWILLVMSVESNHLAMNGCFRILQEYLYCQKTFYSQELSTTWTPNIYDVISVLCNCGCETEKLLPSDVIGVEDSLRTEIIQQFSINDVPIGTMYNRENLRLVLQVLTLALQAKPKYTTTQLTCLFIALCKAALDKSLTSGMLMLEFQASIDSIVKCYSETAWKPEAQKLCVILPVLTSHHHNKTYLAQLLPPGIRGSFLQRRVCYRMLQQIFGLTCNDPDKFEKFEIKMLHQFLPLMQSTVKEDVYKLSSCVNLLDMCVGNSFIKSAEKDDLQFLTDQLKKISGDVRDNVCMLDRTRVKDLMVRVTSKWTLILMKVESKQKSIFAYARVKSPQKFRIETLKDSQSDHDSEQSGHSDMEHSEEESEVVQMVTQKTTG